MELLVFEEKGKPEYPGREKPSEQGENQQQTQQNIWRWVWESNLDHIGGKQVLSPLHHPCSSYLNLF